MPLIQGLLLYFLGGFAAALVYQFAVKRRRVVEGLHLAVIFGLATMVVVFVLAVVFDLTNLTPEPA